MSGRVCISAEEHWYRARATISQGLCSLGMKCQPKECGICNIGHGLPASILACAYWSINVCRGLSVQVVACAYRCVIVLKGIHPWSQSIRQATSIVPCAHRTSNIKQHAKTACTPQSWHTCIYSAIFDVACTHQLGDIFQWQATLYKAIMHHTWHVRIGRARFVVACMHQPSYVGQRHAALAKALTHLTWFLHIRNETSDKDQHHHPKICIHNQWRV